MRTGTRATVARASLSLGLVAALPCAAAAPAGFASETLPNGLEVSILADQTHPVVATQLWYHVGSADERSGERGLAHLFEHLMFGRTETHAAREYWDLHHRHGGYDNAFTSPDETVYVSTIAPEAHADVLVLEADRMRNLVIDEENLENERKIVSEELRLRTENDPISRVYVAAQRALLGDHPYSHDPSGTKADVEAASVESCRRFYDAHYHPNRAHLVIVGPVDPAATLDLVRERFGPLPAGGTAPDPVPALAETEFPAETVLEEDLPPVETALAGFVLPPPADTREHWALVVLLELLAGGEVDPFEEELVRRRGKALAAGTESLSLRRGGALVFYSAQLPYRRKRTAFRLMEQARVRLSGMEWLTDESLEAAKRKLRLYEEASRYYAGARAGALGTARWWQGDAALAFERGSRIAAVTREDVARAYARYVGEPEPIRLYVRPERVPLLVRLLGWVYPLVD